MELKTFFAQDLQGNVIASPTVYLYQPGTTIAVTGLKDKDGNAITNPFTGGPTGQIQFAVADGDYDLRIVSGGRDFTQRVRFIDSTAGSAQILREDLADTTGAELVGADDGHSGSLWTTVAAFIAFLLSSLGASVIGWIQSGVGAVWRSIMDKLRESVSVKDFGAVGDGITDDSAAIANACNAALAGVGRLYWPAGDYRVASTATINTLAGGLLMYGNSPNSIGTRANIIQDDINTPVFKVRGANLTARGLAFTVFAGAAKTAAGAAITVISATSNTITLSADPWPGRTPVIWALASSIAATDSTTYASAGVVNVFGSFVFSGATKNGDGTVTLTGVKGFNGTANAAISGTVGHSIESFVSLAHAVADAAVTNDRAAIFDMDVRENQFFDNLWFNQCCRVFAYDALGSGGGFDTGAGNAGFFSNIVVDQAKWFIDSNGAINAGQFSNVQLYGVLTGFKADGNFSDCNLTNVKFITCTKGFDITGDMIGVTMTGSSVNAITGQGYINGFISVAGSITDTTINGNTFGRSTSGTAPITCGTANGFTLTGNTIVSHNEGGTGGFLAVTGASFINSRVSGNNFEAKNGSGTNRIVFTNTSATITGSVFGSDVAKYTNHTGIGWIGMSSLSNSWTTVAGTRAPSYSKDENGMVSLSGVIGGGTVNAAIFTLPSGYRPSSTIRCPIAVSGVFGYLDITNAGTVTLYSSGANSWAALDGVSFPAA